MTEFLFVYGTLMRPFHSGIIAILRKRSSFVATGRIKGKLYDIGHYPGLVYDQAGASFVKGEILKMSYPERLLPILDDYEMIDPQTPDGNEYKRLLLPVQADREYLCWTYVYQFSTTHLTAIDSGDYLTYFDQNPRHQEFIDKN